MRMLAPLFFVLGLLLPFNSPAQFQKVPLAKLSSEEQAKIENLAIRYLVRMIELAAPEIRGPEEFAEIFLSTRSREERALILKHYQGMPVVVRTSETALALLTPSKRLVIDFRDILKNTVYLNGTKWTANPKESMLKTWPLWRRKIEHLHRQSNGSTVLNLMGLISETSIAEGKIGSALRATKKLEELAEIAAEKAAKKAAEEAAEKASKEAAERAGREAVENYRIKKLEEETAALREQIAQIPKPVPPPGFLKKLGDNAVTGISLATVFGLFELIKGPLLDLAKSYTCESMEIKTPECVNARVTLKTAEEKLNEAPQLEGGATEERAALAAQYFKLTKVRCRKNIPDDPIEMDVTIKNADGSETKVHAKMKWNADGKAESGQLSDIKNPNAASVTYSFTDGRLSEVCLVKPKEDLSDDTTKKADPVSAANEKKCMKESSTGPEKDDFSAHELLVWRLDFENTACGKQKAKEIENQPKTPPVPAGKIQVTQ